MSEDGSIDTWRAVQLLRRLGISPKIAGFQYAVYGISLGSKKDRRCLSVINWIYPEIARHYQIIDISQMMIYIVYIVIN